MVIRRLAIMISGRVHGVGFRFFSRDAAESFGLTGWVRNTPHRTVEMEIQGEQARHYPDTDTMEIEQIRIVLR